MEEQHKSKIVWVLFVIIVALVGLNIYQWYLANNLEDEVSDEVAVVETSATPTATATTSVSATPTATATVSTSNGGSTPTLDEVCSDIYYHHYVAEEKKVGDMVCYFDNNNQTINSNYALFQVHECSQLDSKTGKCVGGGGQARAAKINGIWILLETNNGMPPIGDCIKLKAFNFPQEWAPSKCLDYETNETIDYVNVE